MVWARKASRHSRNGCENALLIADDEARYSLSVGAVQDYDVTCLVSNRYELPLFAVDRSSKQHRRHRRVVVVHVIWGNLVIPLKPRPRPGNIERNDTVGVKV